MKHMMRCILALVIVCSLAACTKTQEHVAEETSIQQEPELSIDEETSIQQESELSIDDEVLTYLSNKYAMKFNLRCSDGQDLYVFYIFPDHAERSCDILMSANTDDVSVYTKNLSWAVSGDELIITGEWEESFKIDISTGTATSTTSNKVYQIVKPQPPLE